MSAKASSHKLILALILALAMSLAWSAAALAVTPEDVQYGPPTSSVDDTTGTGGSGNGGSGNGGSELEGSGSVALLGTASETGTDPSSGSIGLTGLLPETGGLSLVALGATALIGTGLTLLRYRPKSN